MQLAQMKCTPYKTGSPPLIRKEMMDLLGQVQGWSLQGGISPAPLRFLMQPPASHLSRRLQVSPRKKGTSRTSL